MVVGQAPMMLASAMSPPLHLARLACSMPATAQGYPTFLTSGPAMGSASMPCASLTPPLSMPSSPLTPPSTAGSSPMLPPVTCNIVPASSSAVFTYASVPTNLYTGMPVMSYNPPVTLSCKVPDNQISTSISNVIPCNSTIYTCPTMPPSTILPCQHRMISGTIMQCAPGSCQYSLPTGSIQMCPVTNNLSIPNSAPLYSVPPSMSIAQNICSTNVVTPWKQSYGMEHVWRKEFETLFYTYTRHCQHIWTLLPVTERPGGVWYEHVDSAKVRFCCDACGHGWTSMKGRVAFWFILNYTTNEGVVCLKLYGQQCDRCKRGDYEPAMWYPEEVLKVIVNVYNRIGQVYYGFEQAPYHKTRRPGKPRTPHNSDLCQACKDGVCSEKRQEVFLPKI